MQDEERQRHHNAIRVLSDQIDELEIKLELKKFRTELLYLSITLNLVFSYFMLT